MRVTIINASQRGPKGNTQVLIDNLCKGLERGGADYNLVYLSQKNISLCTACDHCHKTGDCIIEDDVTEVFDALAESELIVFAFPIYSFHFPAKLKALFERMYSLGDNKDLLVSNHGLVFHQLNKDICGKPYAVIVNYGNIEYAAVKSSINFFKSYTEFTDAPNIGILQRNTMKILANYEKSDDQSKSPNIEQILMAYQTAGYELAKNGQISTKTQAIANQEIIPLPFFRILKHIKMKWFKSKLVKIGKKVSTVQ